MHDIRSIRENPAAFDAGMARRSVEPQSAQILALDEQRRALATRAQEGQSRRNEASKAIGKAMGQGDTATAEALKAEVAALKKSLPALEAEEKAVTAQLNELLAALPNIPVDEVPEGADENDNVEVAKWGTPGTYAFTPREHADIGPALGLDFETGAKISGARFTFLKGQMARLHRALAQFMLDTQTTANGFMECNVPLLVKDETAYGTGQLPKFSEDLFQTTDGRWLIPTAEVSLTNAVQGEIVDNAELPLRMTALTPCFRSEAGAAGRDTRGFIRQHQFEKVELVTVCRPDESEAEHEKMVAAAEGILQALELPYRKVLLCSGDMGATAKKTFDLEVWLPGQGAYREISSISNCGDFQARRMNARYKPEGSKKTEFLHTLNGSGLAVGRTLVAVLENYQQEDGSVRVPDVLKPWMGGLEVLTPRS
ncbi:serine--tRNA ligase [Novosphingobium mangrovi (ex Hu et al. 2023)]|uniref:Serine--tRNA ligase n=1 Tax=Novosphingobium mangrovi (ex Hu et al. 2023) TaxID=2930094 RepID=A0ABT0AH99_9SPHN|nr:serine--tRNA ligase [Novosphingobium mangrovi (ex Hu et al. 2023)]MCJ1962540.1 serine--tRNA ligase [Novosphingobium mangrovi (ex Hu et al. 2023)]